MVIDKIVLFPIARDGELPRDDLVEVPRVLELLHQVDIGVASIRIPVGKKVRLCLHEQGVFLQLAVGPAFGGVLEFFGGLVVALLPEEGFAVLKRGPRRLPVRLHTDELLRKPLNPFRCPLKHSFVGIEALIDGELFHRIAQRSSRSRSRPRRATAGQWQTANRHQPAEQQWFLDTTRHPCLLLFFGNCTVEEFRDDSRPVESVYQLAVRVSAFRPGIGAT